MVFLFLSNPVPFFVLMLHIRTDGAATCVMNHERDPIAVLLPEF
jgi:hypothetical protein